MDISKSAGISFRYQNSRTPNRYLVETFGAGCAFIDYDGDGWQDILLLNGAQLPGGHVDGTPTMRLYRNNHNGTFSDVTHAAGLDRQAFYAMGVAVGDYDNDGREDIYVTAALGPSHLFHNEGGRFRDVTKEAGVENAGMWGTSCAWVDYDKDGKLDLFVCNYVRYRTLADDPLCNAGRSHEHTYCNPTAYQTSRCALFHNEGGGRFKDVSVASGIAAATGKSLGVTVWDYDGDGWPDIFVANDTVPGFLFHNERNGTFKEVGVETGVALTPDGQAHSGMGIDADDRRGDGRASLVITNYYGTGTSYYDQTQPNLFQDISHANGIAGETTRVLGFGIFFFDFDNDGLKDILQVNGHVEDDIERREPGTGYAERTLLFHNTGNGYREVGSQAGSPFDRRIVGRGAAWGDIDNDGRLDVLITNNQGTAMLLHNETPGVNHWLTLKLIGKRSNRDGIGALVTVTSDGKTQRTLVRSGSSYLSQSDLRPHFGLGASDRAAVEIRWPSGVVDRLRDVQAGHIWTVAEGEGRAQ